MDNYQRYGLGAIGLSVVFFVVISHGTSLVALGGIVYGLLFLFHARLERGLIPQLRHPLRTYGLLVVLNGLFLEVLAYLENLPKIHAGEKAYLFATGSLADDLVISLPYYVTLALVYMWVLKRYQFSVFEFAGVIWLFWAICVDEGSHMVALFSGTLEGVVGFVMAGVMMLFTLHGAIVLFEPTFSRVYPTRSRSWRRFPLAFFLQGLSLIAAFGFAVIRYKLLPFVRA